MGVGVIRGKISTPVYGVQYDNILYRCRPTAAIMCLHSSPFEMVMVKKKGFFYAFTTLYLQCRTRRTLELAADLKIIALFIVICYLNLWSQHGKFLRVESKLKKKVCLFYKHAEKEYFMCNFTSIINNAEFN